MPKNPNRDENLPRREFFRLVSGGALAIVAAEALAGCGSAGNGAGQTTRATFAVNATPEVLATDNGQNISFLAALTDTKAKRAVYWGVADANQQPSRISQALYWDADVAKGILTQYDSQGLPVFVIHEANTAFMTVTWDTNRAIFKFYQPAGDYVGGSVVTRQGATFAATKLLGSSIQGTFGGSLTGLTQGIVSLTLIGGAGRAISRAIASRQIVPNTRTVKSPPVPHALIPASRAASGRTRDVSTTLQLVKAFAGNVVGNNLPAFAKDLINVIAAQRKTTGSSAIATSITTAALTGASTTAPFLNGGDPLMQGLTVVPMLADAAAALIVRIDLGEDVESKGDATNASASPANTNYITSVDFKIPDTTGDNSIVMGLAAAREFGSIPLSGVIDASNQLRISGTAKTGEQIVLTGNVVDNKVRNGAWNLDDTRAVTRAAGGSWDADPTQPGQCTVEENSGGQGIFTQTYDLGMNCGSFDFRYQAFSIPDQFQVFYEGKTMLDTGSVSGGTTVPILFGGTTNQVIVVVTASLEGTQWNYTVGCPTPHTT